MMYFSFLRLKCKNFKSDCFYRVYDHMIEDGNLYLVMECLETDLKNYLHGPNGGLAEEELMDEILAKVKQVIKHQYYHDSLGSFFLQLAQ